MSPDIEWHVGEDAEQETIANTSNARRSRRSLWAVIIAIGLGVGLALLYRSIPEPSPKPIDPTPAPTVVQSPLSPLPTPESIAAAIERDAQRLSASAGEATRRITFDDSAKVEYAEWYTALQNAYGQWGPPSYQTLYTVFETGTLPSGVTWVKLGQFRHGDFYRHTRFYRLENDRWVWTLPDRSFWGGATAAVMTGDASAIGPITIGHPIEDEPVISPVFDRFTRAYLNLCESLKCPPPADPARLWTPGLTLTIMIKPMLMQPVVQEHRGTVSIDLPSPRVVGYYEDANARGDPYVSMAYATLIDPVVRLASGDYARWETDRGGELFLQAIATWKRARLPDDLFLMGVFYQPTSLPPSSAYMPDGQLNLAAPALRGDAAPRNTAAAGFVVGLAHRRTGLWAAATRGGQSSRGDRRLPRRTIRARRRGAFPQCAGISTIAGGSDRSGVARFVRRVQSAVDAVDHR